MSAETREKNGTTAQKEIMMITKSRITSSIILTLLFTATVVGANAALEQWGIVAVGFGLYAPAGVFFAGIAFTLRDALHESGGRFWVFGAIAIGGIISWTIEPVFALASATAFTLSELIDFAIYTPLRKRNWLMAVTLSNTGGLIADSALFLWLAFGSLDYMDGQVVGKAYMTALVVIPLYLYRRLR